MFGNVSSKGRLLIIEGDDICEELKRVNSTLFLSSTILARSRTCGIISSYLKQNYSEKIKYRFFWRDWNIFILVDFFYLFYQFLDFFVGFLFFFFKTGLKKTNNSVANLFTSEKLFYYNIQRDLKKKKLYFTVSQKSCWIKSYVIDLLVGILGVGREKEGNRDLIHIKKTGSIRWTKAQEDVSKQFTKTRSIRWANAYEKVCNQVCENISICRAKAW